MASLRKKGQTIRGEAREVIRHVINVCDKEAYLEKLQLTLKQGDLRAANYTGISVHNVASIREGVEAGKELAIHSEEARGIIRRVIAKCDEECHSGTVQHALKQSNLRVSNYTGVSIRSVTAIRKEGIAAGEAPLTTPGTKRPYSEEKKFHMDESDVEAVRDIIRDFDKQKTAATAPNLFAAVQEKIDFPWGIHTFRRLLREMGFKW